MIYFAIASKYDYLGKNKYLDFIGGLIDGIVFMLLIIIPLLA